MKLGPESVRRYGRVEVRFHSVRDFRTSSLQLPEGLIQIGPDTDGGFIATLKKDHGGENAARIRRNLFESRLVVPKRVSQNPFDPVSSGSVAS